MNTQKTSPQPLQKSLQKPLQLLGGLSAQVFMQRYWQKKPLLIRAALPDFTPLLSRPELFRLAAQEEVQSRLVVQADSPRTVKNQQAQWSLAHGPFKRTQLPPLKQAGWTLLVQSVNLWDLRVHDLMQQFRFIPDARLDDVMVSYASDGGGVGAHFDSYDVFLLQAHGRRRWRIGRQKDLRLQPGMPLKILSHFEPQQEFVLEAGDMLYLPPRYAHEGVAQGECMTYSIGFRAPSQGELARELLQRMADHAADEASEAAASLYRDPQQAAVTDAVTGTVTGAGAAQIPEQLFAFAQAAVQKAMATPDALKQALGEYLSEPHASVWFDDQGSSAMPMAAVCLDHRTRMLYDARHIYINGESFRASGRDARLMRALADTRALDSHQCQSLSPAAQELLDQWCQAGWVQPVG